MPEKRELMARHRHSVFIVPDSYYAFAQMAAHLVFNGMGVESTEQPSMDDQKSAFEAANHLVSDDMCIMVPDGDQFVLAAACLCAPTFWSLEEMLGRPLAGLHGAVPGGDPMLASRITRIFKALRKDVFLERFNWTVQFGGERFTPSSAPMKAALLKLSPEEAARKLCLRVERQTVRSLDYNGAVLFTIRVSVDPLGPILANAAYREAFETAWRKTDTALRNYKGWPHYEAAVDHLLAHT